MRASELKTSVEHNKLDSGGYRNTNRLDTTKSTMLEDCLPDEQGANTFDRRLLCQSALAEGSTSPSNVRRRSNIFTGTCKYTRVSLAAFTATDKVDIIC